MKYLFLFIVCISFRVSLRAQCDSSIIGTWKTISVISGDLKLDFENDSVSISRKSTIPDPDSASQRIKLEMVKVLFQEFQYTFNKDGSFELTMTNDIKEQGSYCFNKEKDLITMTSKNSLGAIVSIETKASITKGILRIKMDMDEEEVFEVILRRKID